MLSGEKATAPPTGLGILGAGALAWPCPMEQEPSRASWLQVMRGSQRSLSSRASPELQASQKYPGTVSSCVGG